MLLAKFVIISRIVLAFCKQWRHYKICNHFKDVRVFCKQWRNYHHEQFWAKVQRHCSTSSNENIKTMLMARFVIISKMYWRFVNNGGITFTSDFGPKSKDTLAPLVVKILKQCYRYWQNLLSFQKCEGVW